MDKLFPKTFRALRVAGYPVESARLVLRDARRGDACSLVMVRVACNAHKTSRRFVFEALRIDALHLEA